MKIDKKCGQVFYMLIDYHVHLDKLEWSKESVEDMCSIAIKNRVDRIGVVVHTKILDGFQPLYAHILSDGELHKKLTFNKNIDEYMSLLEYIKGEGYPVDIGLEVCYSPEGEEFLEDKLKKYPFDFTIGSVHLIQNMHFKTAIEYYKDSEFVGELYYYLILKAIESKLFDIIGHMEIARREGIPGLDHYPDIQDKICNALILNDCAVEINTKWLTKHVYLVPDNKTLRFMADRGVKLVFGSDAHHTTRIGFARDIAEMEIKKAGYNTFSVVS